MVALISLTVKVSASDTAQRRSRIVGVPTRPGMLGVAP